MIDLSSVWPDTAVVKYWQTLFVHLKLLTACLAAQANQNNETANIVRKVSPLSMHYK